MTKGDTTCRRCGKPLPALMVGWQDTHASATTCLNNLAADRKVARQLATEVLALGPMFVHQPVLALAQQVLGEG